LKLVEALKVRLRVEEMHLINFKELSEQQLAEMIDKGV